ncbi:MAG: SDR family NAD(P)-dependent oxidoreductase [Anaerolineae bacterium]
MNAADAIYRLDGQVGLVTGSANGIGREIALGLAAAGANVIIADLPSQAEHAAQTAQGVAEQGQRALCVTLDVTSIASIEAAVAAAVAEFGRLDFLVNNAGANIRKPVLEYTEAEWDKITSVNLKGVFFCSQIAARQMMKQGKGKIVNIASQLAAVAMKDRAIYAVTKAGVAHMAKAFALELAPCVQVNAVGPTFVSTAFTTSMFTDPAFVAENLPKIPCGRFGATSDVLAAVRFLLSPAADMVNGQLLLVDGGFTIA